jgi:hypothetical protein
MLTSQRNPIAFERHTIMYPTRIVIRCSFSRALIVALAMGAWLILSAIVSGNAPNEARANTGHNNIYFRVLSACAERAYPSYESRHFGGVYVEIGQSELIRQSSISSQRKSKAFTA